MLWETFRGTISLTPVLTGLVAFVLAAAFTPVVRTVARRTGAVAMPKSDRWHSAPTAMLGGIAIFAAISLTLLIFVPQTTQSWIVIAASAALFLLGLLDDFVRMKPYQKLIGQILAAAALIYFGLVLPWTASTAVNIVITIVWLVGVTNAVNMLDNMDGLAGGIAAIAAFALAANFYLNGQHTEALLLGAFFGGLIGFLIYNHHPASIFMGDCGSMFIGFFLASSALLAEHAGGGRSRSVIAVLAVPVLVLSIPIFDTTFVTLMRKLAGRSAAQGGRDHTSHRLVALGLSERDAVWMLYAFAIMGAGLSLAVRRFGMDVSLAAIAIFAISLTILGVYLAGVRVYSESELEAAKQKPLVSLLVDLSYKRRIFEVGLDFILIVLSYYLGYLAVFGPARATSGDWMLFLKTLPVIVSVKLAMFLVMGVYRGLWRYTSLWDAVGYAKAVLAGSVVSVLVIVYAFRFEGFSRSVFAVDCALLLLFVASSRFTFRVLRRLIPAPHTLTGRRVLIFGAGDGGELLYRELHNNADLGCVPVAFIDDDPRKHGTVLHGLRVYPADDGDLPAICRKVRADEVILSTMKIPLSRLRHVVEQCETIGVPVKRMKIDIERVADREVGWVTPTVPPGIPEPTADSTASAPRLPIEKPRKADERVNTVH